MAQGLTQDQVKDLIYVGAFHYEALLRDKNLINDASNTINGVILYPAWENHMLADFSRLDLDLNLFRRYLPNAYIRFEGYITWRVDACEGQQRIRTVACRCSFGLDR